MTIDKLKELLDEYELTGDCHVVVGNIESPERAERLEIEGTHVDSDGVLNIVTIGREAGSMLDDTVAEFIEEEAADD